VAASSRNGEELGVFGKRRYRHCRQYSSAGQDCAAVHVRFPCSMVGHRRTTAVMCDRCCGLIASRPMPWVKSRPVVTAAAGALAGCAPVRNRVENYDLDMGKNRNIAKTLIISMRIRGWNFWSPSS
jgi:hypothetical protein